MSYYLGFESSFLLSYFHIYLRIFLSIYLYFYLPSSCLPPHYLHFHTSKFRTNHCIEIFAMLMYMEVIYIYSTLVLPLYVVQSTCPLFAT